MGWDEDGDEEPVEVAGEVRAETVLAYLFFDGLSEVWLPKSLCTWDERGKMMALPEWLALKKGLI